MALTPPSPNLMPNLMPFRVGHPYQATACAAPLTMDMLQNSLGRGLLNASRLPIDESRLAGLQNDEAVFMLGQRNIPKTGYPWLDRAVNKAADAADYVPQATEDALANSLKWGAGVGAGVTATTALGLLAFHCRGILEKASKQLLLLMPLSFGVLTGIFASVCAFSYSFLQNFRDLYRHMAKTSVDQKTDRTTVEPNRR